MVTQAPRRSSVIAALAFALSCIGLMVFVWTQFGGTIPFAAQGYRVHALFRETGLLVPNADVRISGVDVGKVVSVEAKGVNSYVTMDIQHAYAPIPTDTRAILRQKTLLGEAYVELSTGTRNGPKFPDGGTIPVSQVADTQALDQVLNAFDRPTQQALQNLLSGFYSAVAGRGEDLNNALGNLDPAVTELSALAGALNDQQGNVHTLIRDTGTVLQTLGDRTTALTGLITSGDQVLSATAQRDAALTATVRSLPPFLGQLRTTLTDLGGTLTIAGPTLHVLRPVAPLVAPALRDVITLERPAVSLLRRAPGLIDAANASLPVITDFMNAFKPAADALLPAAREVAPMIAYAGYFSRDIVASMSNLGTVLQATASARTTSGALGVGAGTAHYLRELSPVNNESVGGQSVRPPTNRHNPYYAPGEQDNIRTGLLASDCANVSNAAQVPLPLGTGNVTCRLQPSWSAGGAPPAYYHHVTRAKVAAPR